MKLRNKQTGEKAEVEINCNSMLVTYENGKLEQYYFGSLKDLDEWEDYEEPETYYYISDLGNIESLTNDHGQNLPEEIWHKAIKHRKEIGNYFETKEEAEETVEKLKAWKRLKDNGFKFKMWEYDDRYATEFPCILIRANKIKNCEDDLDLLFGGEE